MSGLVSESVGEQTSLSINICENYPDSLRQFRKTIGPQVVISKFNCGLEEFVYQISGLYYYWFGHEIRHIQGNMSKKSDVNIIVMLLITFIWLTVHWVPVGVPL